MTSTDAHQETLPGMPAGLDPVQTWVADPGLTALGQAASLMLALLTKAKCASLDEFEHRYAALCNPHHDQDLDPMQRALAGVVLTTDQDQLLREFDGPLRFIRASKPTVSLAVCPTCYNIRRTRFTNADGTLGPEVVVPHGWSAARLAPTRCKVTAGCTGVPVKSPAALLRDTYLRKLEESSA